MSLQAPGSNWLKWLLWPFSLIWGLVAMLRRFWYGRFGRRYIPPVPTVVIGNLSAGGTGKTPMIKWLLARRDQPVAVLSRGYGRKSRGFLEVLHDTSVREAGDEPLEIRHTVAGRHRFLSVKTARKAYAASWKYSLNALKSCWTMAISICR